MTDALRILMTEIVDYAGLFPPAKLDMAPAVRNFGRYFGGEHAWMLGRLVVPVSRLAELERDGAPLWSVPVPRDDGGPWRISALIGDDLNRDIDTVFAFNQRHAPPPPEEAAPEATGSAQGAVQDPATALGGTGPAIGQVGAVIDCIELKAESGVAIDRAMQIVPEQLTPFIEIPTAGDVRGLVAALAGTGGRAKIRTGGLTPDAFPAPGPVARFIFACAAAEVPFKATAGLHHPVRGEFNLTYEPGCPRGVMYGFFNVFVGAALAMGARIGVEEIEQVLVETNPKAFVFDGTGVTWRDRRVDLARLARARESFAISFGSCSFEEPLADLKALGLM